MIALALAFAAAEFGVPVPAPVQAAPAQVQAPAPAPAPEPEPEPANLQRRIYHGSAVADDGTTVLYTFTFDDDGWVTFDDGAVKCVTGAPCSAVAGYDSSRYTYDYVTGEEYTPAR